MDVLWLVGGPAQCYRVPDQHFIVNKAGTLLESAAIYHQPVESVEAFAALCAQVQLLVIVAGAAPQDPIWFDVIPTEITKIMLLTGSDEPDAAVTPVTSFAVDAYGTCAMCQSDFALVVHKTHSDKQALQVLQQELKNFSSIAFTAMSSASEMGAVAVFAEKVQEVMGLDRLAYLLHRCLGDLNLRGVAQFVFEDEICIFPPTSAAAYIQLLNSSRQSSARIVSQGRFLLFSFEHLQLLITDAPVENEERYGRLRDVLAHIVSIAEARAKTLKVNSLLKVQQDNTRTVMMLLEMSSQDNRHAVKEIMTHLSDSLRTIATGFDLNMEQESALLGLSEKALLSLEGLQEATEAVEVHFRSLVQDLETVSLLLEVSDPVASVGEEQDSRVELF